MFGLTVELELCDPQFVAVYGNGSNMSQQYQLSRCRLIGDLVSVDSVIQSQLSQALLEGKALPMQINSWANSFFTVDSSSGSWSVTLSRGFSRLNTVFVTFSSQAGTIQNATGTQCNSFQSWHGNGAYNFTNDSFRIQMSVGGSLLFPDRPMESHAEAYYQLSKALDHHASMDSCSHHSLNLPPAELRPRMGPLQGLGPGRWAWLRSLA